MHADDRAALAATVARLTQAAHPHDHFGTTIGARRSLGFIPRKQTYRRAGVGWRLGVVAVRVPGQVVLDVVGHSVTLLNRPRRSRRQAPHQSTAQFITAPCGW